MIHRRTLSDGSVRAEIKIINRLGLHARAAAKFVQTVNQFEAEVAVWKDGKEVNGKSIMGLMMLAAAKGSKLVVTAKGKDARAVIDALVDLVGRRFDEPN